MKEFVHGNIKLLNMDNMEYIATVPDKYFDLAIVDPPYGIGEDGASNHSRGRLANAKVYSAKGWDKQPPPPEYFAELIRVSKNQIIWGANHFADRFKANSSCWIVWDKVNGDSDFADCELAYASFGSAVRKFEFRWAGMLQGNMKNKELRIHPTQKPKALYDWILLNYSKPGQKILDTHLGSGSSAISAHYFGAGEFVGTEKDSEYFDASVKRYQIETAQEALF